MQCKSIEEVRENIDRIDNEIIKLIAERTGYVKQVVNFKNTAEDVQAADRKETVIRNVRSKAEEYGANPDMIEALYREMISRFINMEMDELKKRES